MRRTILRFAGDGLPATADLDRIRAEAGLTVIDETPRMLLIEAPAATVQALKEALPTWIITPEVSVDRPGPRRPRPRHDS